MIIRNVKTNIYYLIDDITGYSVVNGDQEDPFYAKPCDKNGNVTLDDYVELLPNHNWVQLKLGDEVDEEVISPRMRRRLRS